MGNNVGEFVKKLFIALLVIQFAGPLYLTMVKTPLFHLPDELANAVAHGTSSTTALDQLAGKLDQLIIGLAQAIVAAFKDWNVGGALNLLVAMVCIAFAGSALEIACVFNMVYAKIGIALLLMVGPFFIYCLMVPAARNWFYGWLNTIMYFVFLTVFSTLIMLLFMGVANRFMIKLEAALKAEGDAKLSFVENVYSYLVSAMSNQQAGDAATGAAGSFVHAEINILSISIQMVLVFVPLFLVALEMRTMVASITGGSGGSFGSGMVNVISTAWRGGVGRASPSKK
jgi:type IV secretion system protein VirB6